MNVKELREYLKELPDEMIVIIWEERCDDYYEIAEPELKQTIASIVIESDKEGWRRVKNMEGNYVFITSV